MRDESDDDRTASLMTPAKLAQLQVRPKPAASPAAWLDQLAADAGSGHVRRLVDLRRQLEAQLGERSDAPVAAALQALEAALGALDFSLVQPKGWLARATGKGKEQGAAFAAQHARAAQAAEDVADEVRALTRKQQAQAAAVDRTLVEVDVEVRAIEKIMDQGARWLQDMRNQLKTRQAQGGDAAVLQQIQEDSRRCELLVERLKLLRGVCSAAQSATERSRAIGKSRASVAAAVQQVLDAEAKSWHKRLAPLAEEAAAGGSATQGLEKAQETHERLCAAAAHALADCRGLATQEQALAEELAALAAPLQAAC